MSVRTWTVRPASVLSQRISDERPAVCFSSMQLRPPKIEHDTCESAQTIFGGGSGGRNDAFCRRSDTGCQVSISSAADVTSATRPGTIETG
jgi:hypothetical protein